MTSLLLNWLSRRSLRLLHALGAVLGWAGYALSLSYRQRLRANAAAAGVGLADRRAAVADAGRLVMELPRLWLRPRHQPISDPVQWRGADLLQALLPRGAGYRVHATELVVPLPQAHKGASGGSANDNDAAAALAINRAMEAVILQMPSQYLWGYHRYKSPRQAQAFD